MPVVQARFTRSRRSAVLLIFGVLFVLIGLSYMGLQSQITASPVAAQSYSAHLRLMPLNAWAWIFITCGAVAVAAGVTMRHTAGYVALMAICSWWGLEFIASWLATGYTRAIIGALTWAGLAGALAVIVGWRDPYPLITGPVPGLNRGPD